MVTRDRAPTPPIKCPVSIHGVPGRPLLVTLHSDEDYQYASGDLRNLARFLVEMADRLDAQSGQEGEPMKQSG